MSRTLGRFGLCVAVTCWLVLVSSARATDQDAVAALQKLGGLSARAGSDSEAPVIKVEFNRAALTDEKLEEAVLHMKKLKSLRTVTLGFTKVSDAGLVHLAGLPELEELGLAQTGVTDAGLSHLKELKKLKRLDLVGTKVTDKGAADLKATLPDLDITRGPAPGKK
jgi:Leucine-rich repeat (LRR) protein